MGGSELHGYDLTQSALRQSIHPEARVPRGPAGRWAFARAARSPPARTPRRLGYHSLEMLIRFDSVGGNKNLLGGGIDNGLECDGCTEPARNIGLLHPYEDPDTYAPCQLLGTCDQISRKNGVIINLCKSYSAHA
jgi:hypothetical protein